MTMLKDELCGVVSISDIGGGYRFLQLDAPKLAAELQPGQFIHVKVPGLEPSALRRPFSVFDAIIPAHKRDYLDEAEEQVSPKGSDDAKNRCPPFTLTDYSKVASAECTEANGN